MRRVRRVFELAGKMCIIAALLLQLALAASWGCIDSSSQSGFGTCAVPNHCGSSYQGDVVCHDSSNIAPEDTCSDPKPVAVPVFMGCSPSFSSASASFNSVQKTLTITYEINSPSEFLAEDDYSAVLDFAEWNVDVSSASCCSPVTCSISGSKLTIFLGKVSESGSFIVTNLTSLVYAFEADIGIDVVAIGFPRSVYTGKSPLAVSSINITPLSPVFAAATFVRIDSSTGTGSVGSVLLSLSMGNTGKPVVDGEVTSIRMSTNVEPGSSECSIAALSATASTPWPLGLAFVSATLIGDGDGQFLIVIPSTLAASVKSLGHVFVRFDIASDPNSESIVTVSFDATTHLSVSSMLAVMPVAAPSVSTNPSYVLIANFQAAVSALDISGNDLSAALSADATASDSGDSSNGIVAVKVSLSGFNRVFAGVLTDDVFLASLVAATTSYAKTAAAGLVYSAAVAAARIIEEGLWLCGDEDTFNECVVENNCGAEPTKPLICATADKKHIADHDACEFVSRSTVAVSKGCGLFMCRGFRGGFVSCSDPTVCLDGCDPTPHAVTDEEKQSLRLKAACVKNGLQVPDSLFCPPALVPAPVYAETCLAKSTCAFICVDTEGYSVPCSSNKSWQSCTADCGPGTQQREVICAAPVGVVDTIEPVPLNKSMCEFALTPPDSRPCTGSSCAGYTWNWVCSPDGSALYPCEVVSSWGECGVTCGSGYQTRHVLCGVFHPNGTRMGVSTSLNKCEDSQGSHPVDTRTCSRNTCDGVEWMCHLPTTPVSSATHCNSTAAFGVCPNNGCSTVSITRKVVCMNQNIPVDSVYCAHMEEPDTVIPCDAVTNQCRVTFEGALCSFTASGEHDPALEGSYCDPGNGVFEVFRLGTCLGVSGEVVDPELCGQASMLQRCALPPCSTQFTFRWVVVPGHCENLNTMCDTFRFNTVTCTANANFGGHMVSITVSDSSCPSSSRPSSISQCTSADGVRGCQRSGKCTRSTGPVFSNGITHPSATFGQCACVSGRGGNFCDTLLFVSAILPQIVNGGDLFVTWRVIGAGSDVDPIIITLDYPNRVFALPIGVETSLSNGVTIPLHKIAQLAPKLGTVTVVIELADLVMSEDITIAPLCSYPAYECKNGGTCSADGVCACRSGFTGTTCESSACSSKGCNPDTSTCVITDGVASCVCETGPGGEKLFEDDLCFTPLACLGEEWTCAHNGTPTGIIVNSTEQICGGCLCKNKFGGDFCSQCTLDDRCLNGTPDEECSRCLCKPGFIGEACSCRQVELSLLIRLSPETDWYIYTPRSSPLFDAWVKGLEQSFNFIFANDPVTASILDHGIATNTTSGRAMLRVTVGISPRDCGALSPSLSEFQTMSLAAADTRTSKQDRALQTAYQAFSAKFRTGVLKRHRTLRLVDFEAGVGVKDFACISPNCLPSIGNGGVTGDVSPSSSGLSTSEKIGIGLGVGIGVLVLVVAVAVICRYDVLCAANADDASADGHFQQDSLEMTQQRISTCDLDRDSQRTGSGR